jgi:acyl-CoA thioesterase-2
LTAGRRASDSATVTDGWDGFDGLEFLLQALDLREVGPDTFVGPGDLENDYGIFGGHLLGQGVAAACRTAPEGRTIHSLHAYFVAAGTAAGDITYRVERIRDGGTFAHREVRALRGERELFRLTASFQGPEAGLEWQAAPSHDPDLPEPDAQPGLPELQS